VRIPKILYFYQESTWLGVMTFHKTCSINVHARGWGVLSDLAEGTSAVLGAYYDVEKNQRFAITGVYRQESYKAVSTTTVMATYTVGL
jgi:hypothetical protein